MTIYDLEILSLFYLYILHLLIKDFLFPWIEKMFLPKKKKIELRRSRNSLTKTISAKNSADVILYEKGDKATNAHGKISESEEWEAIFSIGTWEWRDTNLKSLVTNHHQWAKKCQEFLPNRIFLKFEVIESWFLLWLRSDNRALVFYANIYFY